MIAKNIISQYVEYMTEEQAAFLAATLRTFSNGVSKKDLLDLSQTSGNIDSALPIGLVESIKEHIPNFNVGFNAMRYEGHTSNLVNAAEEFTLKFIDVFSR